MMNLCPTCGAPIDSSVSKKKVPNDLIHISTFDVGLQVKLLKDIKTDLEFFNPVFYESDDPMTGNFYGPYVKAPK